MRRGVVKAYVREDHENEKFNKISLKVFELFTKAEKIVAWNAPIMQFVMYAVVLCLVLIGGESDHYRRYADGRTYQYHGICHADPDVSYDRYLRFCADHDRGGLV